MKAHTILTAALFLSVSCAKVPSKTASSLDSAPTTNKSAPRAARCSQVSEVESAQIRETLILQVQDDVVSGTFHYAIGDRNSLTDTGFQHLLGKISASESGTDGKVVLKLKDASLTTYFDEDFAPSKKISEISFNLKEKKASFTVVDDSRATTVGQCQFE